MPQTAAEIFLSKHKPYCKSAFLALEGGEDFVNNTLVQHARESDAHYQKRRKFSFYLNYVEKITNVLCGFILKGISRTFGTIPEDVYSKYTGALDYYRSINEVMAEKMADFLLTGNAFLLCDAKPEKGRAFVHSFDYRHIIDFGLNDGEIESITLELDKDSFLRVTATKFEKWKAESANKEETANSVGTVAVVALSKKLDLVRPYFRDAIQTNKALYNHFNNINQMLYDAGFSILAIPSGQKGDIDPDTLRFVEFNPAYPEMLPRYITPPTDHLEFYVTYIDGIIDRMLGTLNIYRSEEKNTSGLSKSYDYSMMTAVLSSLSTKFQAFETQMWKELARFDPDLKPEEIKTQYPKEFDLTTLKEELDNVLTLLSVQISSTFDRAIKKRIVSKQIDDEKLRTAIEKEIDAESDRPPVDFVNDKDQKEQTVE